MKQQHSASQGGTFCPHYWIPSSDGRCISGRELASSWILEGLQPVCWFLPLCGLEATLVQKKMPVAQYVPQVPMHLHFCTFKRLVLWVISLYSWPVAAPIIWKAFLNPLLVYEGDRAMQSTPAWAVINPVCPGLTVLCPSILSHIHTHLISLLFPELQLWIWHVLLQFLSLAWLFDFLWSTLCSWMWV